MTLASHKDPKQLAIPQLSLALSSSCDRRLTVDGVSLELRREQIMRVVGKSGSGQSLSLADLIGPNYSMELSSLSTGLKVFTGAI